MPNSFGYIVPTTLRLWVIFSTAYPLPHGYSLSSPKDSSTILQNQNITKRREARGSGAGRNRHTWREWPRPRPIKFWKLSSLFLRPRTLGSTWTIRKPRSACPPTLLHNWYRG